MEFAIEILETEKKKLERTINGKNPLQNNMSESRKVLNQIKQLKQVIKLLKAHLHSKVKA